MIRLEIYLRKLIIQIHFLMFSSKYRCYLHKCSSYRFCALAGWGFVEIAKAVRRTFAQVMRPILQMQHTVGREYLLSFGVFYCCSIWCIWISPSKAPGHHRQDSDKCDCIWLFSKIFRSKHYPMRASFHPWRSVYYVYS